VVGETNVKRILNIIISFLSFYKDVIFVIFTLNPKPHVLKNVVLAHLRPFHVLKPHFGGGVKHMKWT